MYRLRVLPFAVAFLVVFAAAVPASGGAQEATPVPPRQPAQPTTGPGSSETRFGGMTTIEQKPPDALVADYLLFVPSAPLPGTAQEGEPLPVVIFLHGSGATNADAYLAWIEHLVWRGAVVLFPLYERPTAAGTLDYQQTVQDDVREGLERLEHDGVPVDLTRVAVVGHSLGAEQALVYAASAATADLPVPTAVMSVAPGCFPMDSEGPCFQVGLGTIPTMTRLLLVSGEDDPGTSGIAQIWAELASVPLDNRDVVIPVTDTHGKPRLTADHFQALAGHGATSGYSSPDAFDWYGTWKWLDALMGCSFDGEWCEYALGNTPEQRYMGIWSDGVPVAQPIVTDEPT
jgi:acetyl esterase/lipase